MLLDASHRKWIFGTIVLFLVMTAIYIPHARSAMHGPSGGSWIGLFYGVVGIGMMLFAGIIGLRRKVPTWRVGRATTWMKGHIWLGLLSYVIILYHAGFAWGGALTFVIMTLFTIVVLSGIYGWILQQIIPRMMLKELPLETVFEQIDPIVAQLRAEADALVAAVAGPLPVEETKVSSGRLRGGGGLEEGQVLARPVVRARFEARATWPTAGPETEAFRDTYLTQVRPFLADKVARNGKPSDAVPSPAVFQHLRTVVPPPVGDVVDELQAICEERRQLAVQKRLHHWLHSWLLVHVPLSYALLLLSIVHAVIALRY
jgi:hypothetical protein